jgi:hypothetical protein
MLGGLAILEILVFRGQEDRETQPWTTVAAACVAVQATFLMMRQLHSGLWGLLAAGLLTFHPFFQTAAANDGPAFWAQTSAWATLAAAILAAHLTYSTYFYWFAWLLLVGSLALGPGLSWFWNVPTGLLAALLVVVGLLPTAFLGLCFRRQQPAARPAWPNLLAAAAVSLLAPACGLLLVALYQRPVGATGSSSLASEVAALKDWLIPHPTLDRLESWCWPNAWVLGLVALWAIWRSLRRGLKQWRSRQPPLAWQLTLTVLWIGSWLFLLSSHETSGPPLLFTALATLLSVFLAADVWRGLMDRLVLRPPEEPAKKG